MIDTKRYEEGIEHFKKALEINPNHAEIYNGLGLALRISKRVD